MTPEKNSNYVRQSDCRQITIKLKWESLIVNSVQNATQELRFAFI